MTAMTVVMMADSAEAESAEVALVPQTQVVRFQLVLEPHPMSVAAAAETRSAQLTFQLDLIRSCASR